MGLCHSRFLDILVFRTDGGTSTLGISLFFYFFFLSVFFWDKAKFTLLSPPPAHLLMEGVKSRIDGSCNLCWCGETVVAELARSAL